MPSAKQRIAALLVDRIDLVGAGDNPEAKVSLWKRRADEPTDKARRCAQCGALMTADATECPSCGWTSGKTTKEDAVTTATKSKRVIWTEIEKAAEKLDAPTIEQRVAKLLDTDAGAELKAQYDAAEWDEPVEKIAPAPELSPIEKAHADAATIAKTNGEDSPEFAEAMARRYEELGHIDQAREWRIAAGQ